MSMDDLTGRNLGGYRILRKLGQGGMAVVYKAHEESLNRVVALKVIGKHLSQEPQFIERFKREAEAAAQLNHPNIVQIYAIGEDQGIHFFAMEYVKGRTVAEMVEEEGFVTVGRAVPIIAQATNALAAAHEAGIVHRDIKPANIIVDTSRRAKVADFGIAQMASGNKLTQSGMLVGTPEYISPEQCHGEKLDGRSDIYSLGVTMYQMLTGRTPFSADTPAGLVLQIVEGKIPPVAQFNPTIPADVQHIVGKMMAINRDERFQSADDLLDALRHVKAQPASSGERARVAAAAPAGAAPPPNTKPDEKHATPAQAAATRLLDSDAEAVGVAPPAGTTEVVPPAPAPTDAASPLPAPTVPTTPESAPATAVPPRAAAPPVAAATPPVAAAVTPRGRHRPTALTTVAAAVVLALLIFFAWRLLPGAGPDSATGGTVVDGPARPFTKTTAPPTDGSDQGGSDPSNARGGGAQTGGTQGAAAREASIDRPEQPGSGAGTASTSVAAAGGTTPPSTVEALPAASIAAPAGSSGSRAAAGAAAQETGTVAAPEIVRPPANSIVASVSGQYEYINQIGAWVESVFARDDFALIDYASIPDADLAAAARYQVVTSAEIVGSRQLEYFGRSQTQYTLALTMRAIDLQSGATVAGPVNSSIEYTSVNQQQNLERGTRDLSSRLARDLRRLIRTP